MIKKIIILNLISFIGFAFQEVRDDKIYWSSDNKLNWENFQGKPGAKSNTSRDAASKVAIRYNASNAGSFASVTIKTIFYKNLSWKRLTAPSNELLKHEQGHFDLTEISARKFRKSVLSGKFYESGISKDLKILYDRVISDWSKAQDLYDMETDHSKNKAKQLEWEKKIAQELKSLEDFSNSELTIVLSEN